MMSLVGDKSSVWILWLPCGGRKSGVGAESGAGTSAARDRGDPGVGTGSVWWLAAGGVAKSLRGGKPARLRPASGPHWAASANGAGRPAGPLSLDWATRE
jgi:hypothetical protein